MADLSIFTFDEGELYPRRRNIFPKANGRIPVPQILWLFDDFRLAFFGVIALNDNALFELLNRFVGDLSIDLGKVGSGVRLFGIEKILDQFSVIGE